MTDSFLKFNNFFLVGIKGVAMTSMAQLLRDAEKNVSGSDVEEDFVTQKILEKLSIEISTGFKNEIPKNIDCVIYTAAHDGKYNPQVIDAQKKGIQTFSHAEAQAELFNMKKGVAVCGVGGKSTVSAMISWILIKADREPSFAVGVGEISGLDKTSQWQSDTDIFVAEADEYVTDPRAPQNNEAITPRFSFLKPFITVCTNLKFDHPDVYKNFDHTKETFFKFFNQIHQNGFLILNYEALKDLPSTSASTTLTFGTNSNADFYLNEFNMTSEPGLNIGSLTYKNENYKISLKIPGIYNLENAVAAIAACLMLDVSILESINALESFNSTKRRFEKINTINGVEFYDDYAHHPDEIKSVIQALNNWYPDSKKIIAFQPHTYSRTKKLLDEFIKSFSEVDFKSELILLDIFSSARENFDSSISSDDIVSGIKNKNNNINVSNIRTVKNLSNYFEENLKPKDVVLTLGAGDIYKVHELSYKLSSKFPEIEFINEHKLAQHTTVKIGGPAEVFCETKTSEEFTDLVKYSIKNNIPLTLLGWGANTLISDNGIRGLVIKNTAKNITVLKEKDESINLIENNKGDNKSNIAPRWNADKHLGSFKYEFSDLNYDESSSPVVFVEIDSGVSIPFAINFLLDKQITGLQWYSRIPATLGGAIYNNIHGGTHFISEVISSVKVIDSVGNIKNISANDLGAGYDTSRFHTSNEIIVSAVLKLYLGDVDKAKTVSKEWATRKSLQPRKSLGCVFQNISDQEKADHKYPTTSVGYIIDHVLDKKNFQIGDAKISEKHAAFIVNTNNATSEDYLKIIKTIINETKIKTGITLKPEIFFLGFKKNELAGIIS